ncbi:helix-turn-helix domain-containing protein [Methylovirgula sp. 4M-Z18]|uniref:helix-turn-helix domain-containing protein n=1 Tax=Methylovirgula sp. 4M-Z18 TaxID=2293567 RepID=UPI000E2EF354|nr:helix-turn-helix transcriptional regulator [Methylovirgula sp. 4M-Z18]RFB76648.1 XRE family transcriptional regulator [Methylovirgula sp. 4M-Z18]
MMQLERSHPSIDAFAEAAGIATGTLHKIKTGKSNITIKTLEIIASRLNIPVGELLGITDDDWKISAAKVGIDLDAVDEFIAGPHRVGGKTRSIRDFFNIQHGTSGSDTVRSGS